MVVTFTVVSKRNSAKCFCTTKVHVAGLGKKIFPAKFSGIRYVVLIGDYGAGMHGIYYTVNGQYAACPVHVQCTWMHTVEFPHEDCACIFRACAQPTVMPRAYGAI